MKRNLWLMLDIVMLISSVVGLILSILAVMGNNAPKDRSIMQLITAVLWILSITPRIYVAIKERRIKK
jgi:uncharacterized membrane-anchored protein